MTEWLDVSDDEPRVAYTATSGQTLFPVPFAFLDESHLAVYINDDLQTLSTDYTTSGAEDEDGGSITLVTGATLNESVVIRRNVPIELTTHIPTSGPLDIPAVNLQFSLIVMMMQRIADEAQRGIIQPDSDVDGLSRLPAASARASKYLGFDADGDVAVFEAVTGTAAVAAFWVTVLQTADAAAARTALGITDQSAYNGAFNHLHFR